MREQQKRPLPWILCNSLTELSEVAGAGIRYITQQVPGRNKNEVLVPRERAELKRSFGYVRTYADECRTESTEVQVQV